ncbi:class IIb bacteriocin, lactobin A/cerein 7B family [Prevotellaceae bacterium LKV-178-WT-2A]|uniref:Class IIb bacteriocin, lactobin A/cerein 7B family n=2 Tax=Hallella mizrahii TaxID=2606637 RepID=A0A7K0KEA9_9BACT|nr:class IIb bacteriocin, lactobin A/cerein 7B family [Hallella mizrahii]
MHKIKFCTMEELNDEELKTIDGGFPWLAVLGYAAGGACGALVGAGVAAGCVYLAYKAVRSAK